MGSAEREADLLPAPGERSKDIMPIGLQDASEAVPVRLCSPALAIGRIEVSDHRRNAVAPKLIVAAVGS